MKAAKVKVVKNTLALCNELYTLFSCSPKKLHILENAAKSIDLVHKKLVQPGETRWLSYEGSIQVVLEQYQPLCLALEAIHVDSGKE